LELCRGFCDLLGDLGAHAGQAEEDAVAEALEVVVGLGEAAENAVAAELVEGFAEPAPEECDE